MRLLSKGQSNLGLRYMWIETRKKYISKKKTMQMYVNIRITSSHTVRHAFGNVKWKPIKGISLCIHSQFIISYDVWIRSLVNIYIVPNFDKIIMVSVLINHLIVLNLISFSTNWYAVVSTLQLAFFAKFYLILQPFSVATSIFTASKQSELQILHIWWVRIGTLQLKR